MPYDLSRGWHALPTGTVTPLRMYIAQPATPGHYPAVLIGMELFGLTAHIREITDRIAELGYVAVAPDFYHRSQHDAELAYTTEGRAQGFTLLHNMTRQQVLTDIGTVRDWLITQPQVLTSFGFIGFSLGAHIAYLAASEYVFSACACFYGGWLTCTDIPLSRPEPTLERTPGIAINGGELIYFSGGNDPLITAEQRNLIQHALQQAGVNHELIVYPEATHGFFCDQRDTFNIVAHDAAWQRVQILLAKRLQHQN